MLMFGQCIGRGTYGLHHLLPVVLCGRSVRTINHDVAPSMVVCCAGHARSEFFA
jgi:hypothetical protein